MPARMQSSERISVAPVCSWIIAPVAASALFWSIFGACVSTGVPADPPESKLVASWDPLACGEPHRVVLELVDEDEQPVTSSAPCALGSLTLELPHFGTFTGRVYSWELGKPVRSIAPVEIVAEEPVVRWRVTTPP
jgi:hypothetical protein